jgi:uncharacterized SAM-binding protein YcdF (DUF218 family)
MFDESFMKALSIKLTRLLSAMFIAALLSLIWMESDYSYDFRVAAKNQLLDKLTSEVLPPDDKVIDVAYILGGGSKSLRYKYKTVADLYKDGKVNRVWILQKRGRSDAHKNRIAQSSESELRTLEGYGVPRDKIELIPVDEGMFGTYSEARDVSHEIIKDHYTTVLLVSSAHHTKRLKESFQSFITKQPEVDLYIKASDEQVYLTEMISEYVKLNVYRLLFNDGIA